MTRLTRLAPSVALALAATPAAAQELRITSVTFPQPTCIDGPAGQFCDTGGEEKHQECFDPPIGCIDVYDSAMAHQDATGVLAESQTRPDASNPTTSIGISSIAHSGFEVDDDEGNPFRPSGTFFGVSEMIVEVMVVPSDSGSAEWVEVEASLEWGIWTFATGGAATANATGTFRITAPDGTTLEAGGSVTDNDPPNEGELSTTFTAQVGDTFTVYVYSTVDSITDEADVAEAKSNTYIGLNVRPKCVDIGGLTLCGEELTDQGAGIWTSNGKTSVDVDGETVLVLNGTLNVDVNALQIGGTASIKVPATVMPSIGALPLYSGSFQLSVSDTALDAANGLASKWSPAGLALLITSLELTTSQVRASGVLTMPVGLSSLEVNATARYDASGIQFEGAGGCLRIPEAALAGSEWKLLDVCMQYTWAKDGDSFSASFDTEFNDLRTKGGFELVSGSLDRVWVASDLPFDWGPPIPQLGVDHAFAVTEMSAEINNLRQAGAYRMRGTTQLAYGPDAPLLGGASVITGDLEFTYAEKFAQVTGSGTMRLFRPQTPTTLPYFDVLYDGFPISSGAITYAPAAGFTAFGWIDLFGVVEGELEQFDVLPDGTLRGRGEFALRMPSSLPGFLNPGGVIYGVRGDFDKSGLKLCYRVSKLEFCASIDPTGQDVNFTNNWDDLFGPMPGNAFDNPAAGASILAHAEWVTGSSSFLLTAPDGTAYDSRNMPPQDEVTFTEAANGSSAWFIVQSADAGTWDIEAVDDSTSGIGYTALGANVAPTVAITEGAPVVGATVGQPLAIPFDAFDPDDQATVSFALLTDPEEPAGVALASPAPILESDGAGIAQLDLPGDLQPGTYWLRAEIDDNRNLPRTHRALTRYEVSNPALLQAPHFVLVREQLDHVLVSFAPANAGPIPTGYQVTLTEASAHDSTPVVRTLAAHRRVVRIRAKDLRAGAPYWVRVSAIDDQDRLGASTDAILVRAPIALEGSAPTIVARPASLAPAGAPWSFEVRAIDADGNGSSLDVLPRAEVAGATVPAGLSWSQTGAGVWTLALDGSDPADLHALLLRVTDSEGLVSELDWTLTLLDTLPDNSAPEVTTLPAPRVAPGELWSYSIGAADVDGDSLSFELLEAPTGTQLVRDTLSLATDGALVGTHRISVVVRDGEVDTVHSFLLSVSQAPSGGPRYGLGRASDSNGKTLQ